MIARAASRLVLLGAALYGAYVAFVRPWHLRWGAADAEVERALPGDELVADPRLSATRAITIAAPPDGVWPWIVQIGQMRGGFYSYDWLEILLGLGIESTDRIVPELQRLEVGDRVPLSQVSAMTVAAIEPGRSLVLRARMHPLTARAVAPGDRHAGTYVDGSWAFVLEPIGERTARLIVRFRADYRPLVLGGLFVHGLLEPAHFVMERRMLQGIRERAERSARRPATAPG